MKFPEIIYLDKKIEINIIIARIIILLLKIFFISMNKLSLRLLFFKELLKSNNKSITIGKTTIRAEILMLIHEIIDDKINALEKLSLFIFQNIYEIAHTDSPKNNGFPMVLH